MTNTELEKATKGTVWHVVTRTAPHVLWILFLVLVFSLIGSDRIYDVLSRTSKVGVAGVELEFHSEIDAIANSEDVELPPYVRAQLVRRIERLYPLIDGTRLLWVDDFPDNNISEIGIMSRLGASIDLATSTKSAREKLSEGIYDIVISDMGRSGNDDAGLDLINEVETAPLNPKLIYYSSGAVQRQTKTPPSVFGVTDRPDELLNLILDAIVRRRG